MKKTMLQVCAAVILLAGCPDPVVRPRFIVPTDTPSCPAACAHLRELHCPEGDPIPHPEHPDDRTFDITCEKFCQDTQNSGHPLQPSCVVRIHKCSDMQRVQTSNTCPF